jgi:hypothetical protein
VHRVLRIVLLKLDQDDLAAAVSLSQRRGQTFRRQRVLASSTSPPTELTPLGTPPLVLSSEPLREWTAVVGCDDEGPPTVWPSKSTPLVFSWCESSSSVSPPLSK